jgi:uncharacterized protein involved in outer membrane biogenesis
MGWFSGIRTLPSYRKWLIAGVAAVGLYTLFGFFALPAILKSVFQKSLTEALHRKSTVREIRVNPFSLSAALLGLEISERNGPGRWISAEEVFTNLEMASVIRGGPVLSEVRLTRPYLNIVRRPDGTYNFTDLLEEFSKKPAKESKPLKYSLNNIRIVDGRIDFDDGPKNARHVVAGIQVSVPFVSNLRYYVDEYIRPSFAAVVNGDNVSFQGRTKPFKDSLETSFDIVIAGLDIPRYLEYLPFRRDYEVPSAFLDVKAVLSFLQRKDGPPSVRVDGSATLRDVRVTGKDRTPMVHLPSVRAVISPADIGAREFRLASLTVRDPEIDVAIDRKGKVNLLSLLPGNKEEKVPERKEEKSSPVAREGGPETVFSIDSIRLSDGKLRFSDASRSTPFRTALGDIRIDVDRLSSEKGKAADASLSLSTEAKESLGIKGTLSLAPFGSEGTVTLGNVVLGKYAPYYRDAVLFDVTGGTLDLQTGYRYAPASDKGRIRILGLGAAVAGLRIRQREEREEFLGIPELFVKGAEIDPDGKEVAVAEIATGRGRIAVRRGPGGEMNVSRLVPGGAVGSAKTPAPGTGGKGTAEKPWVVKIGKASLDRYAVRFEDRATDPPVEIALDGLRLRAQNVTTEKNRKGTFHFAATYNREGNISLGGSFSVDPPTLAGKLKAKNLPIGPLQPYYTEKVKLLVTGGGISAEGTARIAAPKGRPIRADFRGEASVNDFASVDKARGEPFLRFAALHFGGMEVGYHPTSVAIRDISLADFYSRIIVNPDGTLNVQGIVAKEPAPDNAAAAPPPAPAEGAADAEPPPVRIDTVTLQGGAVNFSDHFVRPNYSASLLEIGGRVSGLSSEETRLADVDLRGKLENSAPLEIKGRINPLAKDLFLDLKVDFKDMDLSPLTPYSGRYAGYEIRKGKLTLNLKYHIEKSRLEADNKVFLDQFTFGESVDSPDATKLPVRLAVALLKDRQGEIHLDLPVTGRIDDPKFSIWGVVWKIIGNLLVKAATSPFALIGALFGGGEELSYLEFEPGRSAVPAAAAGKLESLAKALYDRPALKLEIEGHVDMEKDPDALRQLAFRRRIAAQKVKALVKAGQPAPALDNVRIDPPEYPRYLALAYKEERFPKPRNFLGMAKDLPVPEMEKLMLAHIRVTDGDLRQLAVERAAGVRDVLLAGGKVEPGRVFLVEPKALAPERKEKMKDSRVDFRIQ